MKPAGFRWNVWPSKTGKNRLKSNKMKHAPLRYWIVCKLGVKSNDIGHMISTVISHIQNFLVLSHTYRLSKNEFQWLVFDEFYNIFRGHNYSLDLIPLISWILVKHIIFKGNVNVDNAVGVDLLYWYDYNNTQWHYDVTRFEIYCDVKLFMNACWIYATLKWITTTISNFGPMVCV